jgi:signal recognition particle GTPase
MTRNNTKSNKVHKILLTGGPCAGKTTSLAKLQSTLDNKGFRVFCVPEAATLMMKGGAILDTSNLSWEFKVQM